MKYLKNIVFSAAVFFTLITYFATLFMNSSGISAFVLNVSTMSRILAFSAVLGILSLVFELKVSRGTARAIHFILMSLNFAVVLATVAYGNDFRMLFAATLVFMVV